MSTYSSPRIGPPPREAESRFEHHPLLPCPVGERTRKTSDRPACGSIRSLAARVAVFLILVGTLAIARAGRWIRRMAGLKRATRQPGQLRLLLAGTFYNENWFRSHILPLTRTDMLGQIDVVTDRPLFPVDKVRYRCPPAWLCRLVGRCPARALTMLWVAIRGRHDVLMGYHIMPNSLLCLAIAGMVGGHAVFQLTGGPTQIIGGGAGSENCLLSQLKRPSTLLEQLLFQVVRQFDLVVVRGRQALGFLRSGGLARSCLVITGGIDTDRFCPADGPKEYDLVYVARLAECKGIEYFIDVCAALVTRRPDLRVAIVGEGPLRAQLASRVARRGLADAIHFLGQRDDVPEILAKSRVFALTSPSEGMSIAMLEAMAAGLPVAVTDVGEARDAVEQGSTGVFLCRADPSADAARLADLLADDDFLARASRRAREAVAERFSVAAMARRWDAWLNALEVKTGP